MPLWIMSEENPVFHFIFEEKGIQPILFDIVTDLTVYQLYFNEYMPSNNDKILLLLKAYLYERTYIKTLNSIGFINLSTGSVIHYEITPTIREQLEQILQFLQKKYNLYSAESHDLVQQPS